MPRFREEKVKCGSCKRGWVKGKCPRRRQHVPHEKCRTCGNIGLDDDYDVPCSDCGGTGRVTEIIRG